MKPKQPFFFLKPTSSMLLAGEGKCIRPKGVDMHYEVELALIMGKVVRDLQADDAQGAMDAIKGEFFFLFTSIYFPQINVLLHNPRVIGKEEQNR
jgi:hypothetical protein